eukprot:gene632-3940_t
MLPDGESNPDLVGESHFLVTTAATAAAIVVTVIIGTGIVTATVIAQWIFFATDL